VSSGIIPLKISKIFAVLEGLDDRRNTNTTWENIRENCGSPSKEKIPQNERKPHKQLCQEECSKPVDKRNG
jgi:hypothetical protein